MRSRQLPASACVSCRCRRPVWGALSARRGGFARVTSIERARRSWTRTRGASLRGSEDAYLFDAHTHLGDDIDGMQSRYGSSRDSSSATGSRARSSSAWTSRIATQVTALTTTGRWSTQRDPNGRLFPFARLDLTAGDAGGGTSLRLMPEHGGSSSIRARRRSRSTTSSGPIFELACERGVPISSTGARASPDRGAPRDPRQTKRRRPADRCACGDCRHGRPRGAAR